MAAMGHDDAIDILPYGNISMMTLFSAQNNQRSNHGVEGFDS